MLNAKKFTNSSYKNAYINFVIKIQFLFIALILVPLQLFEHSKLTNLVPSGSHGLVEYHNGKYSGKKKLKLKKMKMNIFNFLGKIATDSHPQPAFTFSKLTIEALEQGLKCVQS